MGNILIQMAEIKDLSPSERHVVDYILEHYQEVCSMGIVEHGRENLHLYHNGQAALPEAGRGQLHPTFAFACPLPRITLCTRIS